MRGTHLALCTLMLFAWAGNVRAEVSVTRITAYAGAATWLTGTTLGLISKNKANATYDQYLMATDSESARAYYQDYDALVDDANMFLIVGYSGLGVCLASYLVDRATKGRWASVEPSYEAGQYRLAWAIKY